MSADTTCDTCGELLQKDPANTWQRTCAHTWRERTVLHGHTDEASAYVVDDYPYGFRERTTIRYWIETTKRGQRFVSQTVNPKTGKWNKPKKSTYQDVMVLVLDDNEHVSNTGLPTWPSECELQRMESMLGEHISEHQRKAIATARLYNKAAKHITYDVHVAQPGETRQTQEEVARIWGAALNAAANE